MNVRKRIFEIIEVARPDDRASSVYDSFMLALIVISLVPLGFKTEYPVLRVLDRGCAVIFSLDYILRLITADYKYQKHSAVSFIKYPFSFMALVDLLSILPSFTAINGSLKVLRVMRVFRALRVLRVFKLARYSKNVRIILAVIRHSRDALVAVGSMAVLYVLICALVILNLEPNSFDSLFEAIYWATVSLTTMGYGDIYPVSAAGRFFTMLSAILGIAIIALPSGIITAGYMNELRRQEEEEEREEKAKRLEEADKRARENIQPVEEKGIRAEEKGDEENQHIEGEQRMEGNRQLVYTERGWKETERGW